MSNEPEESLLLERAFLRIGSAQSDDQFENLIDKLLGPVIFKVPSPYESVRRKAIELLTHVSKRIKCRPAVQVPVKSLLQLYKQANNDQFVKNFLIVYIKLGYQRMPPEKQVDCLTLLMDCMEDSKTTDQLKNSFLNLFIRTCSYFVNGAATKLFISSHNLLNWKNLDLILEIFYDILLMPYSFDDYTNNNKVPPGMSSYSFKRITQDGRIEDFFQVKLGILHLLEASNIQAERIIVHFVAASVDTNSDVSALGKQHIKNEHGTFEWTSETLRPLYTLFVGDNEKVPEDRRRRPVDLRIKIILLPYLQKLHAYCWPECIQVVVSCLHEETNSKIKISGLNFGLTALQKAEIDSFKEVAPNFLNILTEILWKKDMEENVRILTYRLSGNVIALNPDLVKNYKEIFPKFIEDLTEEKNSDVKNTIMESLMKMAESFKQTEEPEALMHFLANRITSHVPCVKQIVLHYLSKVFPSDDVRSRFLLSWATADSDTLIRSCADQALNSDLKPRSRLDSEAVRRRMPLFADILRFFYDKVIKNGELIDRFEFGDQNLILSNFSYIKLLVYIRSCMLYDCETSLCAIKFEHPCVHSPKIKSFLTKKCDEDSITVDHYINLICQIICKTEHIDALKCLLECVGTVPKKLAPRIFKKPVLLSKILHHPNEEVNYLAATLHGIVLSFSDVGLEEIKKKFEEFTTILNSKMQDHVPLLVALWSIASFAERDGFELMRVPVSLIESIVDKLSHNSPVVVAAACYCLGQIGRRNDLPLPNQNLIDSVKYGEFDGLHFTNECGSSRMLTETSSEEAIEAIGTLSKLKIVEKLLDLTVDKNTNYKVKMKAAEALGLLCVGDANFPYRKLVINTIIEKENEVKEVGQLMDYGTVISDCIMGPCSIRSLDQWLKSEEDFEIPNSWDYNKSKELFMFTYNKIATDLVSPEKSKSKMAAAVWLLVLMRKCLKVSLYFNELSQIQCTFIELMLQNDDVIHDVATRGLSFIPRFTNPDNASALAKQLSDNISLIQKKRTEIGSVLSMYKEFSYLVSSLKNYALIYHFLNLLNHQNQLADDKYFSEFKEHEKKSISELAPYYPQMVPSLYVYRFHPSAKIKSAMNTIWSTLFPDSVKTIRTYSKAILEKSIPELTCPVSELRIAYCLTLEDLLRIEGNKFVRDNGNLISNLLSNLYQLMDDIYDTVRRTAYGTTKMYLQAIVQNVLRAKGKQPVQNDLLSGILPTLLSVGVASTVKDVKSLSVHTLLDIIDHLGAQIKNHLPTLIPVMIENASEVEMDMRYVEQRLGIEFSDASNDTIMSGHFSTEIIKRCINHVDEEVLEKLLPRLLELLKENISFSTRNAAINFVILLSRTMAADKLQPFVGKLLGALFNGLSNTHKNIRKNSASAIGSLSKFAKETSIDNLLTKLVQLYMKNMQDENIKSAVGQTLLAIGGQCQEVVQAKSEKIVPVIFFAMHLKKTVDGLNDQYIELWNEVWNDVIGSVEVTLSKHKVAILLFLRDSHASLSWTVKAQAARAVSTFVTKCSDELCNCVELQLLTQDMLATVNGKFWHGKEEIVEAVAALCSRKEINEGLRIQILEAVLRECDRGNILYQAAALETLGKILTSSDSQLNYFTDIYGKLKTIILTNDDDTRLSEEAEESSALINQRIKLKETAYFVLGQAWPNDIETQNRFQEEVVSMLTECLFRSTRLTQVSIMVSLKNLLNKLIILKRIQFTPDEVQTLTRIISNVEKSLTYAVEVKKHTLLKKEALHVMINLIEIFHEYNNATFLKRIHRLFMEHSSVLMKDSDPIVVLQTSQLKDLIKRTT